MKPLQDGSLTVTDLLECKFLEDRDRLYLLCSLECIEHSGGLQILGKYGLCKYISDIQILDILQCKVK